MKPNEFPAGEEGVSVNVCVSGRVVLFRARDLRHSNLSTPVSSELRSFLRGRTFVRDAFIVSVVEVPRHDDTTKFILDQPDSFIVIPLSLRCKRLDTSKASRPLTVG